MSETNYASNFDVIEVTGLTSASVIVLLLSWSDWKAIYYNISDLFLLKKILLKFCRNSQWDSKFENRVFL